MKKSEGKCIRRRVIKIRKFYGKKKKSPGGRVPGVPSAFTCSVHENYPCA